MRIAMTLDLKEGKFDEYQERHAAIWPDVQKALHEVGLRNISLWIWQNRLFYYAEYNGQEPFSQAMARYEKMPRVQEWEDLMHTYQVQLPGTNPSSGVWWQACQEIYHQE